MKSAKSESKKIKVSIEKMMAAITAKIAANDGDTWPKMGDLGHVADELKDICMFLGIEV